MYAFSAPEASLKLYPKQNNHALELEVILGVYKAGAFSRSAGL
jgi:hypothetical protein